MESLPSARRPERGIWPTDKELASLGSTNEHIPPSRMQIMTMEDMEYLINLDKEEAMKKARVADQSEVVNLVEAGDLLSLRSMLIAQKDSLTAADLNEALWMACKKATNLDIIRLLHRAGADINAASESNDTPLHVACHQRNEMLAKLLIDAGADLHRKGDLGRTPLHVAAVVDFESGAALLLRSGANVEAQDNGTWTPLHLACGYGSPGTQRVLMSNGADVNYQDEDGWTALHQAACQGNIENARILLAAGARIDVGATPDGFTPLHTAIAYENKAMLLFLLKSGADHLRRTSAGFTLLQLAVLADAHPILQELLEWSTDSIDEQSIDKSSAIHIAAGRGSSITVNLLRAYGANINLVDVNGLNPRDIAAKFGHISIVVNFDIAKPNVVKYPRLCSTCERAEIISLLSGLWGLHTFDIGTYDAVSQRFDCPFCSMVFRMFPRDASKYVDSEGASSEITIRREGAAFVRFEVSFCGTCYGYIQVDNRPNLPKQLAGFTTENMYVAVNVLDYSMIRRWISDCEKEHTYMSPAATLPSPQRKPHGILLIDVKLQCLVAGTINHRYTALSYVWGRTQSFQATLATEKAMKVKGFLETLELPRVIQDAISFVEKLGERYIWIDSLCIIQDDPVHKNLQLMQMDLIYSNALLTLVAVAAFDADSGLAGIFTYPRASAWSTAYVDDQRLVSRPPEFNTIFSNSKYRSRAWTLQENILSPRCLYITNNQVFYSCHGNLRTEDHRQTTSDENKASKSVNWFRDALAEAQLPHSPGMLEYKWMQLFSTYSRLVNECTSRNLSNPADVLNAVLGPMMTLSPYLGQFSLAGLPDTHIDYALLWAPRGKGVKNRNKHFPSWSWAGWDCGSTYYNAPVYLGATGDPIPLLPAIERFETFWQTKPRIIETQFKQTPATFDPQAWDSSMRQVNDFRPLDHVQERASATQVLSFDTRIVQRGYFDIADGRPRLRMMNPPEPVVTLFDRSGIHCGVLYDDIDSIRSMMANEGSEWTFSFILLSSTDAPPASQEFFFNTDVYKRSPLCLHNIMLVKELYDPVLRAKDRILSKDWPEPDRPVTQRFERVAIGQVHADAWDETQNFLWHITLY